MSDAVCEKGNDVDRSYHDMTWLEFKQVVESGGVQESDVIVRIMTDEPTVWHDIGGGECNDVDVYRSINGRFIVEG